MARQEDSKGLPSGKGVRVLKGRKRLGKIAKAVAPDVVELIPPLSEPLDAGATYASIESCRRLGHVDACPRKTKTACNVRTELYARSSTARATVVGTPNRGARPSVDEVNPPGLARNPPTRSDLVHRMERAIMLPGEQTRLCIGGKRVRGNRSLTDARRNNRTKDRKRRTSERKNKKKYLPNHVQILRLFAKVLPLQHVEAFRSSLVKLGGLSDDLLEDTIENEGDLDKPFESHPCNDNKAGCRPTGTGTLPKKLTGIPESSCPENEVICQTPLAWVDGALRATFGDINVCLQRCREVAAPSLSRLDNIAGKNEDASAVCKDVTRNDEVSDYFLEFIAMDCVLERVLETVTSEATDGTPQDRDHVTHVFAKESEHILTEFDFRFCTAIIVLPSAGVFYCARERRKETGGILNSLVPLDISWLRQKCDRGAGVDWFDRGAYVRRLSTGFENMSQRALEAVNGVTSGLDNCITCAVWKWRIRRQGICVPRCGMGLESTLPTQSILRAPSSSVLLVIQAYHCPDDSGPRLPPDFIDGKDQSEQPASKRRITYNERLMISPSVRRHCRRYARSCLHRVIPPNAWTIDPQESPNVDVVIAVQASQTGNSKFHVIRRSVVQIRYLTELHGSVALLRRVRDHAQSVAEGAKSGSARAGCGDMGSMHPIGTRVMQNLTEGKYTSSSDDDCLLALADSVHASAMLASMSVPAVLRVVQDLETDSGLKPTPQMSGDGGSYKVSTSMDLSVNLSNASHFDVHDASQGFSTWTEDYPGSTKNWFFVLPNVYGTKPGTKDSYNGLVIRLYHGVLISWDGRIIRHCTSVMERKASGGKKQSHNVYGTFFAAKTRHITLGQQQCESRLASAWYQEINGVLKKRRKGNEEMKLSSATQKSCPASFECDDSVGESEIPAANCEFDVMAMEDPGADMDDHEPGVLSGKMTSSDEEVLEGAVLEKPLDGTMVEQTEDTTARPGGLVPDVTMLLSDGDGLFDDDDGDLQFEGATSTSDHLTTLSSATATSRCQQQTPTCEHREVPAASAIDRCRQHKEPTRIQYGLVTDIRQKPRTTAESNTRSNEWWGGTYWPWLPSS